MNLKNPLIALVTSFLGVSSVYADRIAEVRPLQQVFQADVIFLGKVTSLESELVQAERTPGGLKAAFQVVSIKVNDPLLGVKGLTQVRAGFIPMPVPQRFPRGANLTLDQEACFMLQKHHQADFYTLIPFSSPLNKNDANFEAELTQIKKLLKVFDNPVPSLQAKEASDRALAACALVAKYRYTHRYRGKTQFKNEPIPAEESKLILQTLAEMDWQKADPTGVFSAANTFQSLGLTPQDGWKPPQPVNGQNYNLTLADAACKWLKQNAGVYRVQRLVAEK